MPNNNANSFECKIVRNAQKKKSKLRNYFWNFWTFFGLPYFWMVLAVIYFFLDQFLVVILLIVAGASYFVTIFPLKLLLKRKRPAEKCDGVERLSRGNTKGFSLPSGHTYNATVFGLVLAVHFKGLIVYAIIITLILMVAISRLYLGAHFLSDVVLAIILAIVVVALFFYALFPAIHLLYLSVLRSFTFTRNLIPKQILRFFFK